MSWFRSIIKRDDSQSPRGGGADSPAGGDSGAAGAFKPSPEKARKWFEHGRTAALSSNSEYALTCFAGAVKLDPGDMNTHGAMWEAAVQHFNAGGKPATRADLKPIDGPGPVERFAAAELAWMRDLNNVSLALRTLDAAAKAHQLEFGKWIAPRIKNIVFRQQKKTKSMFVQAKDAFASVEAWDEAFQCGEAAMKLDPSDTQLINELKELTAQRAIAQGGYAENASKEGGFRANIRDAEKQRALEERESIGGGAETDARNLERARAEYEANPLSPEAVNRYAQLLKRSPQDEETAHGIYMRAFRDLSEYRFRMAAGDIRIAQARRRLKEAREALEAAPDEADAVADAERLRKAAIDLEASEFAERAERYPTDKAIKFELGRLEFERGNHDAAMASFQIAKEDARFRLTSAWMLGRCFAAENWHQEAIGEYREALDVLDASDRDRELEIKYDLMLSMIAVAREEQSLGMAKEAAEICSSILRRNISFRDIRARRKDLDTLIRELGGSAA
ncbi:MAG TPA: hypothetical protein PKC43_11915 [Phycisphaerales bacterium]|nr:hypothetical protein [Phycisphaerales bacterium]HMP38137.1 hypothetical protein [Phycisphaerales bacterium]